MARTQYGYALLDPTKSSYGAVLNQMEAKFKKILGFSNYVPILNLAGTHALIKKYDVIQIPSNCVIEDNFEPSTRDMSERETPVML